MGMHYPSQEETRTRVEATCRQWCQKCGATYHKAHRCHLQETSKASYPLAGSQDPTLGMLKYDTKACHKTKKKQLVERRLQLQSDLELYHMFGEQHPVEASLIQSFETFVKLKPYNVIQWKCTIDGCPTCDKHKSDNASAQHEDPFCMYIAKH